MILTTSLESVSLRTQALTQVIYSTFDGVFFNILDYNYRMVYFVDYNSIFPLMTNKISILVYGIVSLLFAFVLILFIDFTFEGSICCLYCNYHFFLKKYDFPL